MIYDRLVVVEWDDAWSGGNWTSPGEAIESHKPERCWTVGKVVIENDEGIMLAQTFGVGDLGNLWFIPNGMIRSVTSLKKGSPA